MKTLGAKSNSANKKSAQVHAKIEETIIKYEQFKTTLKSLEETLKDIGRNSCSLFAFYDNAGEIELFEAFLFDSFLAKGLK